MLVVDYLPSPLEVDPEPEFDDEGELDRRVRHVAIPMALFVRLRSRSWMTSSAP